jgi:hypothetical protein
MEEIKQLLMQVIVNQVVLYKRMEQLEYKVKGGSRSAPDKAYVDELRKEAQKFLKQM